MENLTTLEKFELIKEQYFDYVEHDKIIDAWFKEIENAIKNKKDASITKKRFAAPTREEVFEYAKSRGREDIADKFYDYFEEGNWVDSRGNKVKNWKQKFITWEQRNVAKKTYTSGYSEEDGSGMLIL